MNLYRVYNGEGCNPACLLMIAPIKTVLRAFRLGPDAHKRLVGETEAENGSGTCLLHFNSKTYDITEAQTVTVVKDHR